MIVGYDSDARFTSGVGTRRMGAGIVAGLPPRSDGTRLAAGTHIMIASSGFGLLALFSLLSVLLGEDRRRASDPSESVQIASHWLD